MERWRGKRERGGERGGGEWDVWEGAGGGREGGREGEREREREKVKTKRGFRMSDDQRHIRWEWKEGGRR